MSAEYLEIKRQETLDRVITNYIIDGTTNYEENTYYANDDIIYRSIKFKGGNNTITFNESVDIDYLIVGGGGSGGTALGLVGYEDWTARSSGGGGAGGFIEGRMTLNNGYAYNISVGSGGNAQTNVLSNGNDGENSSLNTK